MARSILDFMKILDAAPSEVVMFEASNLAPAGGWGGDSKGNRVWSASRYRAPVDLSDHSLTLIFI